MRRMDLLGRAVASVVLGLGLGAGAAPRETSIDVTPVSGLTLDPVLVTPTRTPVELLKTPYAAESVGSTAIEQKGFRSTPEALQEVPGVLVQKTGPAQTSPFIRGFTGFRTLFLVDGIRLNNSTFREGPNQYWGTVDAFSLERLEVVKGPASVLYGSDAIGGTVNAITKDPWTYGDGFQHGANVFLRGASAEKSFIAHPEFSLSSGDRIGLLLQGSYKNFGNIEGGRDAGELENTDYSEGAVDAKLEYYFNPDTRLVFAQQYVRQNNAPRTHSTRYAESFEGTAVGSDLRRDLDQQRSLTYVQLRAENIKNSFIDSAVASLSWQQQYENEDRIRSSGSQEIGEVNVGSLGMFLQLTSPTPIGKLTYGAEYYRDNVSSRSSTNPIQGPVADDATYDLLGIYIQDVIPIGKCFELTLGGRYTYAAADANSVEDPATGERTSLDDDWSAFVGSVRLSYFAIPDRLTVYGGIAQGFRAPNLSDLTRLDIARSGEQEIPSPGLDPEYYTTYEIGAKYGDSNFAIQAAYYFTQINDQIIRTPTSQTNADGDVIVNKSNDGDGWVQGIELGTSWRFHPEWTAFGTIAWQEGELDQFPDSTSAKRREPLSRTLPLTGLVGLRYEATRKWYVEGTVLVAADQDQLSSSDKRDNQRIPPDGTPGYTSVALRSGYRFNKNLAVMGAVENVFNEDYRVHGSGVNAPGTNFILGLTLSY